MSDQTPTQTGELGEMPDPEVEPKEPNPGGVDAVPSDDQNIPADLDPDRDPTTDETPDPVQEELEEGEDTGTEATEAGSEGADAAVDESTE